MCQCSVIHIIGKQKKHSTKMHSASSEEKTYSYEQAL